MPTVAELQNQGICPTCYNFEHGGVYPNFTDRLIYEDNALYCFLEYAPRSIGHTIILIKEHYADMSMVPDDLLSHVFLLAKQVMKALKTILPVDKVYLCTMCDGRINHFHVQLIPRHSDEKIGSTHFVSERQPYNDNPELVQKLRELLSSVLDTF